jgi:subfamily B ATP-binding cassette protein MsbA
MAESGKAFNLNLFKRLLGYTNNYKGTFLYVALAAVLISVFGVLRPLIMQKTIDESIVPKDMENLIFYIVLMIGVLILEVIFMLTFIFFTNWLGQSVIRDIREKLFKLMLSFKQKYYDTSAVGRLTTRAVNDIETISSIFSQGLFVIISDLLKMGVIMGVMLYKSWQLTLIVFSILPIILYATRVFQRAMKSAFEEVRAQVANLNSFVQERAKGRFTQKGIKEDTGKANIA